MANATHRCELDLVGGDDELRQFFWDIPNAKREQVTEISTEEVFYPQGTRVAVCPQSHVESDSHGARLVIDYRSPLHGPQEKKLSFSYKAPSSATIHTSPWRKVAVYYVHFTSGIMNVELLKATVRLPRGSSVLGYSDDPTPARPEPWEVCFTEKGVSPDLHRIHLVLFEKRKRAFEIASAAGLILLGYLSKALAQAVLTRLISIFKAK